MHYLTLARQPFLGLLFGLLCGVCHNASAALDINGMAIHTELGKDQYIAALYLEELSQDVRGVLLSDQRKRMEIKVVTKRLLSRKFKRQWIEGIAINAGNNELKKHAQNLADFNNMLKVKLVQNDTLTIERTFRRGVEVSINRVLLGSIQDKTFFDLLLRTWIGPVPPSTEFKRALLSGGSIDPALLSQFKNIRTTTERVTALEEALAGVTAAIAAAIPSPLAQPSIPTPDATPSGNNNETPEDKPTSEANEVAVAQNTVPSNRTTEANQEPPADEEPIVDETASGEEVASNTATEEVPSEDIAAEEVQAVAASQEDTVATASLENAITGNESLFEEDDGDDFTYTAADLLSRQLYISKLTRWTSSYVKYPKNALRREQQGSVRVTVVIDRKGKVKEQTLETKSPHSSLNKAVIKAVKKASPYPEIPDIIRGDTFIFTVPIAFNLQDG